MSTYNIYQKPCPACSATVSRDASRCECGHSFESINQGALLPEELALQEEELFGAYLAARVDQMVATVETARAELTANSTDQHKAARLLQAVQDALTLRDERETQATKIDLAGKAVSAAREKLTPAAADYPVLSDQPTKTFRSQQMAKAEKIVEAFVNIQTKECPHCKTVLPVTSALCLCGYIYARHDFMLPRAVDNSTRGKIYRPK